MNDPIDARLSALFGGMDTRPDFNARLLDRLQQEIAAEARRALEARRLEQLRHRVATLELRSWGQWKPALKRVVNLETVGIVTLAVVMVSSTWSPDQIRQAAPSVLTAIGLLLAAAPLIASMRRRSNV